MLSSKSQVGSDSDVDTVIILRDPVDRYCSAVRFAMQRYSGKPQIKKLAGLGITTGEQFAHVLSDPDCKYYEYVAAEVMNK